MIRLTMNGPEIVRDAEWAAQRSASSQALTKPSGSSKGDAYRLLPGGGAPSPGGEHFDSWHGDWSHGRRFGLSVNLSVEP